MNHFYEHLVRGESASESLHQAIQWLNNYSENWLPLRGTQLPFRALALRQRDWYINKQFCFATRTDKLGLSFSPFSPAITRFVPPLPQKRENKYNLYRKVTANKTESLEYCKALGRDQVNFCCDTTKILRPPSNPISRRPRFNFLTPRSNFQFSLLSTIQFI